MNRADADTICRIHEDWKTRHRDSHKAQNHTDHTHESSASKATESHSSGLPKHGATGKSHHGSHPHQQLISPPLSISPPILPAEAASRKRHREAQQTSPLEADTVPPGSSAVTAANAPSLNFRAPRIPSKSRPPSFTTRNSQKIYPTGVPFPESTLSSSLFFDAADPTEFPGSSFTTNFLAEFAHTGFTPMTENCQNIPFDWPEAVPSLESSSAAPYASDSDQPGLLQRQLLPGIGTQTDSVTAPDMTPRTPMMPNDLAGRPPLLQAIHLIG